MFIKTLTLNSNNSKGIKKYTSGRGNLNFFVIIAIGNNMSNKNSAKNVNGALMINSAYRKKQYNKATPSLHLSHAQ